MELTAEQIKLPLYALDSYQTYDLLWAENIHTSITGVIASIFGSHFTVTRSPRGILPCLIERYTPYDTIPWANNWSTEVFYFLKLLSVTGLANKPLLTGELWGASEYVLETPDGLDLPAFPAEITLTVKANSSVWVSWLKNTNRGQVVPQYISQGDRTYPEPLSIGIYDKQFKYLKAGEEDKVYRFRTSGWLINSLVISEPSNCFLEAVEGSELVPYEKLEQTLEKILSQLNLPLPRVVASYDVGVEYTIECVYEDSISSPNTIGQSTAFFLGSHGVYTAGNFQHAIVPDWYFYASLVYANNDPWGQESPRADLGKPITLLYDEGEINFRIWYVGVRLFDTSIYALSGYPFHPDLTWENQFFNGFGGNFDSETFSPGALFISSVNSPGSDFSKFTYKTFPVIPEYLLFTSAVRQFYLSSFSFPYYGVAGISSFSDANNTISANFTLNYFSYHSPMIALDQNLVETITNYIFYPRITVIGTTAFYGDSNWQNEFFAARKEQLTVKIVVTLDETSFEVVENSSEEFPHPLDNIYYANGHLISSLDFDYEFSAERYFPVEYKMWGSEPQSIFPFAESDLIAIIDNLQVTYGGHEDYVMPDSVRIKEIHAALQASKFANDDDNPDQLRVANLGYYIERIARVMGISVNSDGSIRSIRQSKWIEQGKPIPAGWTIGQWGRNQGADGSGQPGGNSEEDRDGLAYEVRSNTLEVDKRTGEAKEIKEGGYVLVENWPQAIHILMDDLDRALGLQAAGANVIPSADGGNALTYQGLHSLIAENTYMLSAISQYVSQGLVSSLICQAVLYEVLAAFGLPVVNKEFEIVLDKETKAKVPFPGLSSSSPSTVDMFLWVLTNLSQILGASLVVTTPEEEIQEN